MGSTKLPKKVELRYRKGSTNESRNCEFCLTFLRDQKIMGIGGAHLRTEGRCTIMGLGASIKYRIRKDYTCDAQELDEKKCWWLKGTSNDQTI